MGVPGSDGDHRHRSTDSKLFADWNELYAPAEIGGSDGSALLYTETVTIGMIDHVVRRSDLWGLAINWDSRADSSLDDQVTNELFYRLQRAQNVAHAPSVQRPLDPALNP